MAKYCKKPIVIEAQQFDGTEQSLRVCLAFMGQQDHQVSLAHAVEHGLDVITLEDGHDNRAKHVASVGDYIIKGIQGEFYPCKPDIFTATYDKCVSY